MSERSPTHRLFETDGVQMQNQSGVHISSIKLDHVFKGNLSFKTSTSAYEFGNRWLSRSTPNIDKRPIYFTTMSHFPPRLLYLDPFLSPSRAMAKNGRAHGNFRMILSLRRKPPTATGPARSTADRGIDTYNARREIGMDNQSLGNAMYINLIYVW